MVRGESLRLGVCQAGVQYRHFFAWLLRTIRRLNDDNPAAATEAAAIKVDPSNVAAFLHSQFCMDVVGPELKVGLLHPVVRSCLSFRYHLSAALPPPHMQKSWELPAACWKGSSQWMASRHVCSRVHCVQKNVTKRD